MPKYIEDRPELKQLMREQWNKICPVNDKHTWFGVGIQKHPCDLWVTQELLFQIKPDVILEIGNYTGGSTYALAHFCDIMGKGRIISVDITDENHDPNPLLQNHERIQWIIADATQPNVIETIKGMIEPHERVLVIEDSSHTYANTLAVINAYQDLVRPGDYFIVEDTICWHGLDVGPNPGPWEAVQEFLRNNPNWEADREREKMITTWTPMGYLRRKS